MHTAQAEQQTQNADYTTTPAEAVVVWTEGNDVGNGQDPEPEICFKDKTKLSVFDTASGRTGQLRDVRQQAAQCFGGQTGSVGSQIFNRSGFDCVVVKSMLEMQDTKIVYQRVFVIPVGGGDKVVVFVDKPLPTCSTGDFLRLVEGAAANMYSAVSMYNDRYGTDKGMIRTLRIGGIFEHEDDRPPDTTIEDVRHAICVGLSRAHSARAADAEQQHSSFVVQYSEQTTDMIQDFEDIRKRNKVVGYFAVRGGAETNIDKAALSWRRMLRFCELNSTQERAELHSISDSVKNQAVVCVQRDFTHTHPPRKFFDHTCIPAEPTSAREMAEAVRNDAYSQEDFSKIGNGFYMQRAGSDNPEEREIDNSVATFIRTVKVGDPEETRALIHVQMPDAGECIDNCKQQVCMAAMYMYDMVSNYNTERRIKTQPGAVRVLYLKNWWSDICGESQLNKELVFVYMILGMAKAAKDIGCENQEDTFFIMMNTELEETVTYIILSRQNLIEWSGINDPDKPTNNSSQLWIKRFYERVKSSHQSPLPVKCNAIPAKKNGIPSDLQHTGGPPLPSDRQHTGGSLIPSDLQHTGGSPLPSDQQHTGGSPPFTDREHTGGSPLPPHEQKHTPAMWGNRHAAGPAPTGVGGGELAKFSVGSAADALLQQTSHQVRKIWRFPAATMCKLVNER